MRDAYPGLGFDPAPGEPEAVASLLAVLAEAHAAMRESRSNLSAALRPAGWHGPAATAFQTGTADLPATLTELAGKVAAARDTLAKWQDRLVANQREADHLDRSARGLRALEPVPEVREALDAVLERARRLLARHERQAAVVAGAVRGLTGVVVPPDSWGGEVEWVAATAAQVSGWTGGLAALSGPVGGGSRPASAMAGIVGMPPAGGTSIAAAVPVAASPGLGSALVPAVSVVGSGVPGRTATPGGGVVVVTRPAEGVRGAERRSAETDGPARDRKGRPGHRMGAGRGDARETGTVSVRRGGEAGRIVRGAVEAGIGGGTGTGGTDGLSGSSAAAATGPGPGVGSGPRAGFESGTGPTVGSSSVAGPGAGPVPGAGAGAGTGATPITGPVPGPAAGAGAVAGPGAPSATGPVSGAGTTSATNSGPGAGPGRAPGAGPGSASGSNHNHDPEPDPGPETISGTDAESGAESGTPSGSETPTGPLSSPAPEAHPPADRIPAPQSDLGITALMLGALAGLTTLRPTPTPTPLPGRLHGYLLSHSEPAHDPVLALVHVRRTGDGHLQRRSLFLPLPPAIARLPNATERTENG